MKLQDTSKSVLLWMRANDGAHFADEIAAGCGIEVKKAQGALVSLAKVTKTHPALVVKAEGSRKVIDKDGNEVERTYKTYALSEDGIVAEIE